MKSIPRALFLLALLAGCDGFVGEAKLTTPRPSRAAAPQTPLRVGGEVKAPVAITRMVPDVQRCTTGKIRVRGNPVLEMVIDENGVPQEVRILKSSHPCIDQAVIDAVKQWRFRPGTLRGKPVPVVFNMTAAIHYK